MQCQAMLGSLLKADNILKLSSSFAYSENWGQKQRFLSAASSKEQSWVFSSSYSPDLNSAGKSLEQQSGVPVGKVLGSAHTSLLS